ncbi:SGNH/GDSL hydrolase family protein [Novosphingobium sp.]|uniref:SGNH/GDSL hydrolase family protein n=1 Tax=Novosphingobium sp. TaxID=1874826 RepID=UPI0031E0E9CC
MTACIDLGDSIADGVHAAGPGCLNLAHKGWSSARWYARYRTTRIEADRVVISLGSNDRGIDTAPQIEAIRAQIEAARVVWIIPACNARAARAVETLAARYGDATLRIRSLSPDRVHPTGREYRRLARRIDFLANSY